MSQAKIEFYKGPAGGWGALRSVARQLLQHRIAAKGARTLLSANQPDGFDCPGCAWPDRQHTSSFEFCENGVKAVAAEATADRATPELIGQHTVSALRTWPDHDLEAMGRLTEPLVYRPATDRYERITWDEAFATVARHLRALASPDEAVFYTSGRTSNEAAFLYQLFVREFGTNNFPDCSNMCHEPSGMGLKASVGVGKGTVTLEDFEHADCILIFGQNPGTNHPRMLGELRAAAKRGARILSFNPLRERGLERFADPQSPVEMLGGGATAITSDYFQPQVGGDIAALKGLMKHLLTLDVQARAEGRAPVLDDAFIATHTQGFQALKADLLAEPWPLIERESGLSQAQLHHAAEVIARAQGVIACWGMGITQHRHGVGAVQMIANLLLMRGMVGRPGAGLCPVRGHSNVQGDRTMGIDEKPTTAFLDRLERVYGFAPPRHEGFDTIGAIEAMRDGRAHVFFGMGGNFAAATPDTPATWAALQRCALTVHVATKFNRSHTVHGREALVLPCLGRTEIDQQATGPQHVSVEDSMSTVHLSAGINEPASPHLLSEPMIVARLAEATLPHSRVPWRWLVEDYDRIRDHIERVFDAFQGFNEKVHHPGGFRLRNTASERVWATPSGKAQFAVHAIPQDTAVHEARDQARQAGHQPERVFALTTVRAHDQYNTTVYGLDDRYRGVFGQRRVVFVNAADRQALGLAEGAWVDLVGCAAGDTTERVAPGFKLVDYDIPTGCVAAYYPETNGLVPLSSHAIGARTPTSKSVPVTLRPAQEA
ncbi:FdhF/YdeP family oxidoreductase [Aquabacterium lacunae]|uniref:FdhF/YdeP family oxidoreductase n=1 Tax=Aquabacterium lacunae TaxID=2528630 RepID=A0A4Q9H115_9BURK|nr:FdhF/YdeP family oxidoreductase [Aquabacterium lacunae]TBO27864.1 FdhF/YdeP family oxidoreductase [Aquabacterium lacunae]